MTQEPRRPDIARDLLESATASREARRQLARGVLSATAQQWGIHQERADSGMLKRLLSKHGWPGRSLVGEEAAEAALHLALHADHDPGLQRLCLRMLTEAVQRGDAPIRHWAHLHDRCAVGAGHQQEYGTQHRLDAHGRVVRMPVSEPAHLDARRASVGLPPAAVAYDALRRRYASAPDGASDENGPPDSAKPLFPGQLVGSAA
ncbi:DUF6624 domain-containing protein [Streptomyces sp. NPDC051561]|uniref:DUF6624 domain-containing protein n=1 Tax=Streptomyces sp. NPDC051561 TaxID=3365658 RepID=UPI0037900D2A